MTVIRQHVGLLIMLSILMHLGVIQPSVFRTVLDFVLRGAPLPREHGPFVVPQQREIFLAGGMAVGWA